LRRRRHEIGPCPPSIIAYHHPLDHDRREFLDHHSFKPGRGTSDPDHDGRSGVSGKLPGRFFDRV
jgi:hypothetical protein